MNEAESTLSCKKCGKPMIECGGRCTSAMLESRPMTAEGKSMISGTMSATPDNAPQKIVRNHILINGMKVAISLFLLTSCQTRPSPIAEAIAAKLSQPQGTPMMAAQPQPTPAFQAFFK